jgi:LIVCS family branched-chain amino acid:cation transporter
MSLYKNTLLYGFALFAMFFGSGNLVFPLQVGLLHDAHWFAGFIGLVLTGIILPFLGLFVIKRYHGSYQAFFAQAGTIAQYLLPLFTLSLLGSFGVVPRCITVAYGGIYMLTNSISLGLFSLVFCCICYLVCLKDRVIITILGKWMSPLLLLTLAAIIIQSLLQAPALEPQASSALHAVRDGFLIGYQLMDLFAAFFFSSFIFMQLQKDLPSTTSTREIIRAALGPSIFGIMLLALVYMGLVCLGAHYKPLLATMHPELMLLTIATVAFGTSGAIVIALALLFSCLTTAVALNNIYARYLCTSLRIPASQFYLVLAVTTSIAFCVSLLDFKGIAAFLTPALELSYPSIIALTMLSIITPHHKMVKIVTFYGILALSVLWRFMH